MLQSTGMIRVYADNPEDLFKNMAEGQQNHIEWQRQEADETAVCLGSLWICGAV